MASRLYNVTIDAHDPAALAEFWCQVLAYRVAFSKPDEVGIEHPDDACPAPVFVPVPEEKTVKNRLHLDLAPDDQLAEVQRLLALGAQRVDVGQGMCPGWSWPILRATSFVF